jgi:uncharacterized protein (DUF305 family)
VTAGPYKGLAAMTAVSFVAMYILMYAMVDSFAHVYNNINQVYMAGLMAAPMVLIELWLMRSMYPNRRLNLIAAGAAVGLGVACFLGIRQQTGVADRQFLRSMIPHHAGAILMCEEASLQHPDVRALCGAIVSSQQEEIALMQRLLAREDIR